MCIRDSYYVGLILTQNLGRIGEIHSYTSVWIPNFILLVVVIYVIYKMQKELPFKFMEIFIGFLITVFEFCKNLFGKTNKGLSRKNRGNQKPIPTRPSLKGIDQLRNVSNLRKPD